MKVKLLKDLPFVTAGSIGTFKDGELTFSGETLLYKEEDIKRKYEWFQVLKDGPVWENEYWQVYTNNLGVYLKFGEASYLGIDYKAEERVPVMAAAPDMWRLLKCISDTQPSSWAAKEAKRLLKEIGCTE